MLQRFSLSSLPIRSRSISLAESLHAVETNPSAHCWGSLQVVTNRCMSTTSQVNNNKQQNRRNHPKDMAIRNENLYERSNSTPPAKIDPSMVLSSSPPSSSDLPPNTQKFVKTRLIPGEWDPSHTDPLYRPPWKNRAKIISAEDFAARPTVSFEEELSSLYDGMIVLSWLTEDQRQSIYQAYLDMMSKMASDSDANHVTSHEYAMKVIGQQYNISSVRVAAIVQLAHNEEQIRKDGNADIIHTKAQQYVDAKIREHIRNIYDVYGEVDPQEYVEDPLGSAPDEPGKKQNQISSSSSSSSTINKKETLRVDDLYDVDDLLAKAILREKDEAQLALDSKVYIEDIDEDTIPSNANAECRKLINIKNETTRLMAEKNALRDMSNYFESPLPSGVVPIDSSDTTKDQNRRQRWKYVAKIINERDEKKKSSKKEEGKNKYLSSKKRRDNSLVEIDGIIRLATVKEVSKTSWAPPKNDSEIMYRQVKNAWLNRQKNGVVGGWGRVSNITAENNEDRPKKLQDS